MQVWNVNKYSGVVGVFNIQGSTWSRTRRQFIIHDTSPPHLATVVKPADIPLFSTSLPPKADGASTPLGSQSGSCKDAAAEFAVYSNVTDHMSVMGLHDEVPISLAGEPWQGCLPFCRFRKVSGMSCAHLQSQILKIYRAFPMVGVEIC